jgi:predicted component of type VI protein secretion system
MVTSDGVAKEFPVPRLPLTIGRSPECYLRVPLDSVSRQHCELAENDDEELVIRDLKSSNGTYVNRERVKERELVPGDLLSVGPVVFVVKIDGHPKDIDPVSAFTNGAVAVGGGAPSMIDGVPTWSGTPASAPAPKSGPIPAVGARPSQPAKPASTDDDESFESLLKDLSESDFDIKLPDDDDEPPKKK